MAKSIQLKNKNNEKIYPYPYYPVGSIYSSFNETNPSTLFEGTWEEINTSELIASGTSAQGVNYRVYSDGFVEYFGQISTGEVIPYGSVFLEVNYPFPVIFEETYCQVSREIVGSYWSFVETAINSNSNAYATISVYNNHPESTADSLTVCYRIISKIDLNAQKNTFKNIPKKWRRIS